MSPSRHGRRLVALLVVVFLVTLAPVAAMAADPSAAEREAKEALASRRDRMEAIVAKMRGERGTASGPTGRGMAALDASDLAFLGLREGHGDCAGMWELASEGPGVSCTHGLDLSAPPAKGFVGSCPYDDDCPSPTGWDANNPPTKIPCYTSGPYVQVVYAYWGAGDFANYKERIRRSVASIDLLFNISASTVGGAKRHVRWLMDPSCHLKISAVKLPSSVTDSIGSIKSNLVSRGVITSSVKTLVYVDNDYCAGGVAELAGSSSSSSSNPSNKGGSIALVYDCFSDFDPYAGYGATLGAHELMHTLGAVQDNAPHATAGHCWDDLAAPHEGADIMCYNDYSVSASKFYQRCTPTYPETFDCGKDDYFNPSPPSGSYLATHWNAAKNKFLATTDPTTWETVPKPTVKFTKPSTYGGPIGGTTAATISGGVAGIPIEDVDWTVNGSAVASTSTTPTTLGLGTAKTKTGGYANGTALTISAKVTDEGGLTATGTTKGTVWNPYIRLSTPAAFAEVSGLVGWTANAYATGGRSVTKVQLLVDGVVQATDTTAPYGGTFSAPDSDTFTIAARVTDSAGVTRGTPTRTLYTPELDVRFVAPYVGGSGWDHDFPLRVPAGRTVPITIAASTPLAGGIDHVAFKVGGSTVATDSSAPYTYDLVTSSTLATVAEVTATAVDAGGNQRTTEALWIRSVGTYGAQTATITPNPAASGDDIDFRLVTAPPSGGVIDYACLYVDGYDGVDCLWPSYPGNPDTITVPASTFSAGQHVASWHLSGNTKADYSGTSWELDSGYLRFSVTGSSATPSVVVTGLTPGTKYRGKVSVGATVTDVPASAYVQSVAFYEGGRQLGTDYDAPYTATWNTAVGADGPRTITAVLTMGDATTVRSPGVDVLAVNTSTTLTAPKAGTTVSGLVAMTATGVSDNDCVLESAAFLVDGVVVNTDRVAPFGYTWDSRTKPSGAHTMAVRMQLNDGRTMTTPAITVTVAN